MFKMLKTTGLAFYLFFLVSFGVNAANDYSGIYIFGDSLSDTGNLASVVGDFPYPYYMNRVSNGPVAVDVLSQKLGFDADASLYLLGLNAGGNYAVARARAYGSEAIDLDTQLIAFMANHGFSAPADALYVVFIGGNDLRDSRSLDDKQAVRARVDVTVDKVSQAVQQLSAAGARHFLIVNAPNIGIIPETAQLDQVYAEVDVAKHATKISKLYRVGLRDMVENLQSTLPVEITEFDLFKYFNKLVRDADEYGFTNTTDGCIDSVTYSFHPDCQYGQAVDEFIFFDEIHPTRKVHAMIGEAFYNAVISQ